MLGALRILFYISKFFHLSEIFNHTSIKTTKIIIGETLDVLKKMHSQSVFLLKTSPPYNPQPKPPTYKVQDGKVLIFKRF